MSNIRNFISILFILFFQTSIYSQITPEPLNFNDDIYIDVTNEGRYYKLSLNKDMINLETHYLAISTTPEEYLKPAFIYVSYENETFASLNYRNFSSQELGRNILYININDNMYNDVSNLNVYIYSLEETKVRLQVYLGENIFLQDFPPEFRHKINLSITTNDYNNNKTHFEFNKKFNKTKTVLFYALGESIDYFDFIVQLTDNNETDIEEYTVKQIFDNGYGAVVEISSDIFDEENNITIRVDVKAKEEYIKRKIDVGYEIIDNSDDIEDIREINILEHIYGYAEKETCYKLKDIKDKAATMIINTFTQGVLFRIKDYTNTVVYSLDIFNNYFIRLPYEFYDPDNYFCFKHITPKESDEEVYGEISYDFQIYYEDELSQYQMFIMPLINGKIYTHSLNRGDIMIYRNLAYLGKNDENDYSIYSANMFRIRGNPRLYGFTCNDYPNCAINSENLKNPNKVEEKHPLNMYHINKRLNAEGNTYFSDEGAVYELRKQYMTIVSCESDENDPNKGECKYTIEINNENDLIQLIPDTVFATTIFPSKNYFLISLKDTSPTYLKIHFTVLTGNAELFIYQDKSYTNLYNNYELKSIHRKEIIEISNAIKDYYLLITCSEPAFIQLKYETNEDYKGYDNLMPNEVNIVPINKNSKSYYNLFNPNYYYPLDNEERNNDFYYKINTIDCSMYWGHVNAFEGNLTEYYFEQEKNVLYSYYSTYGFLSQLDKFFHTSSENDNCGLIIYNGEKSEKRPLLVISDMPHKSTFDETYYIFPIIFDVKRDQGIILEFKIYDNDDSTEDNLYSLEILINGQKYEEGSKNINKNQAIFIPTSAYENYCKENLIASLYVKLKKNYVDRKYYITTNFVSSKISPEYIYVNRDYKFYMRKNSSKFFYTQIDQNSEGRVKFDNLPKNTEAYAKVYFKSHIYENHIWNGRIDLPLVGNSNLIELTNGKLKYDKTLTRFLDKGGELYFQVNTSNVESEDELILISFSITHEVYGDYIDTLNYERIIELEKTKNLF